MSKEFRNDCCGCSTESYPCIGDACQYRHVPYLICDECGSDYEDKLYILDGEELCDTCVESHLVPYTDDDGETVYLYEGEFMCIEEILESLPTVTIDDMMWEGEI